MKKLNKLIRKPICLTSTIIILLSFFVLLTQSTIISKLFNFYEFIDTGYTQEVKTIEFTSAGYNSSAGSFLVTKSAEWTNEHEVTISFALDSAEIPKTNAQNIILVMDTSESMDEPRMTSLANAVDLLIEEMIKNTNNKLALISFNTTATTLTNFTNNEATITNIMDNLTAEGATNYYLALKETEELLTNYTPPANTDTHLIFITDGYPTEGGNLYIKQYQQLIEKFPYLITTGIQLDMGEDIILALENISRHQYYAFDEEKDREEDLDLILLDAARPAEYYDSIVLTDYINTKYFTLGSISDVEKTHGKVTIDKTTNGEHIIWTIDKDEVKSETIVVVNLSFVIKLKEEYHDVEAYLPTNSSTTLTATAPRISNISTTTTTTPVLQSWYEVTYKANIPAGCPTTYSYTEKHFPFETVQIRNQSLLCAGSQFKGWEVADADATIVSNEAFIMPGHNTEVGAKWTELSIVKSMSGTINTRTTLYQTIAGQATADNKTSEFVKYYSGISRWEISSDENGKGVYTRADTIGTEYPVHYYRGEVLNNNVIFGGYCWKIIRTTSTGGIKLIYNGPQSGGKCTATGTSTTIGTSKWNELTVGKYGSLADVGYMYGNTYEVSAINLGADEWMEIVGLTVYRMNWSGSSYMFGTSASWNGSKYVLSGVQSYSESSNVNNIAGKYLCYVSGGTATQCTVTYYMFLNADGELRMIQLSNGQTYQQLYNQAFSTTWIYGNDVTYNSSTGMYTLQNTISLKPVEYGDNIARVNGNTKYHYTCMTNSTTCSQVYYVFADVEEFMLASYITLTGGKKVENVVDEMILNSSNTTSSTIKNVIDNWYRTNLTNYTYMLEDTPYCNQRSVIVEEDVNELKGWSKDGISTEFLYYSNRYGLENDACTPNDSFSVNTANGNGKLTYPVGLITTGEVGLAGGITYSYGVDNRNYYLYNGLDYWTMTPSYQNNIYAHGTYVTNGGRTHYYEVVESLYVRPVISLKPGVFVSDGDGTSLNPYIIEME